MINAPFRWYHILMPPAALQIAIFVVCGIIFLAQLFLYDAMEKDIVIYEDVCDVTVGPTNEQGEVTRRGVLAICDNTEIDLGVLERQYLYELLTSNREPVIVCTKTQGEYLKEINWTCQMDPEKDKV